MSNFTPGPWKVQLTYGSISNYNVIPKEKDLAEAAANRNLIEKAPEMYQMIIDLKNTLITTYDVKSDFSGLMNKYIDASEKLLKEIDK